MPAQPHQVHEWKQHDILPALEGAAVIEATGEPLDMAGATAVFFMRASGGALVATGVATIINATQLNPSGINLRYEPQPGQTATAGEGQGRPGADAYYQAEFELRRGASHFQTVPGGRVYIPVTVTPGIA